MKMRVLASAALCLVGVYGCGGGPAAPTRQAPPDVPAAFTSTISATRESGIADFARCLAGDGSASCMSGQRLGVRAVTTAAAVTAPLNLFASAIGSTVTLTWVAPSGGVSTYIIEAGSAPGLANLANFSTGNTATSFSASGIGSGSYYVRVRAVGTAGDVGASSNEALLVVGGTTCTAPGAPSNLVSSVSGSTIVLVWTAASGSPTSYIVEAGSSPGLSNLANSDLGSPTSTLTAPGVGAGTYYIRIRAKNGCGTSAPSNEVVATVGTVARPLFTFSGVGNTVFDMPDTVIKLRVIGIYTGSSSNFIAWLGPQNIACAVVINGGCRLLVNEIIGTFNGYSPTYDATLLTGNGGTSATKTVSITNSNGVRWTFTEVR